MIASIARATFLGMLAGLLILGLAACQPSSAGIAPPTPTAGPAATAPGATPVPGGTRSPETETTLEGFRQLLLDEGIAARNFDLMMLAMANPFTVGYWQAEGGAMQPAEAITLLRDTYLPQGAVISYALNRDLVALLGTDPSAIMPPDAGVVNVVYTTGWGADGLGEALIFIAQPGGTGRFFWQGILITPFGFVAGSGAGGTPITTGGEGTLEGFRQALLDALTSRNYDLLMLTMDETFSIGFWGSEGVSLGAQEAVEQMRTNYLPPGNVITYDLDADIAALLGGRDPAGMWGPDVIVADSIFSDGWGPDGLAEVVLFIAQTIDGVYYWHGMIYAGAGF